MDKIKEFAKKVKSDGMVEDTRTVKEELLDGNVEVIMSLSKEEDSMVQGSWLVKISGVVPEGKDLFHDYNGLEELADDLNVHERYEENPVGFSFLGEEYEEIENDLVEVVCEMFMYNPYEPQMDIPEESEDHDIEFHDSLTL